MKPHTDEYRKWVRGLKPGDTVKVVTEGVSYSGQVDRVSQCYVLVLVPALCYGGTFIRFERDDRRKLNVMRTGEGRYRRPLNPAYSTARILPWEEDS